MLKVYWDKSLSPVVCKSAEQERVEGWDQWFESVGIGEEWRKVKQACADTDQGDADVIRWATILELTRLGSTK